MEDIHCHHIPNTLTMTPKIAQKTVPNNQQKLFLSPQQRVSQHSKSIDQKFGEIHVSLETMDMSMKNLVQKLNEINVSNMNIPEIITSNVSEMLNNHRSKITESLSTIESKLKHCATGIDALQVKANIADTLMKELKNNQMEHDNTVKKMSLLISNLVERIESLENTTLHNSVHQTTNSEKYVKDESVHTELNP